MKHRPAFFGVLLKSLKSFEALKIIICLLLDTAMLAGYLNVS
jgi:hypothetical protein